MIYIALTRAKEWLIYPSGVHVSNQTRAHSHTQVEILGNIILPQDSGDDVEVFRKIIYRL
ncbi:hypothetical protein [Helicobacter bizzozeronii]|uniref:hypothetical protein n=1 Tax=Helicobacter bizzozeronii TaxID=56877 RepID=UPI000CF0C058|nr:hypothetical protein [Helicobacter bizzozeronii]